MVSIRNRSFINLASPVATSRSPKGWQTVGALWAQGAIAKEEGGGVLYILPIFTHMDHMDIYIYTHSTCVRQKVLELNSKKVEVVLFPLGHFQAFSDLSQVKMWIDFGESSPVETRASRMAFI